MHDSHNWSTDGIGVTEEDTNCVDPFEAFLGELIERLEDFLESSQHSRSQARVKEEGCSRFGEPV